jgi:hypothetical protein
MFVKPYSEVMSHLIIVELSHILQVEELIILVWESRTAYYVMLMLDHVKYTVYL